MKIKLTLLLICFCSSLFSETYVCRTYIKGHDGSDVIILYTFEREGNSFIKNEQMNDKEKPKEELSEIIYEKNDILILGVDNSDGMTFYYIDKKELKFYMSVLERTVIPWIENDMVTPLPVGTVMIIDN